MAASHSTPDRSPTSDALPQILAMSHEITVDNTSAFDGPSLNALVTHLSSSPPRIPSTGRLVLQISVIQVLQGFESLAKLQNASEPTFQALWRVLRDHWSSIRNWIAWFLRIADQTTLLERVRIFKAIGPSIDVLSHLPNAQSRINELRWLSLSLSAQAIWRMDQPSDQGELDAFAMASTVCAKLLSLDPPPDQPHDKLAISRNMQTLLNRSGGIYLIC